MNSVDLGWHYIITNHLNKSGINSECKSGDMGVSYWDVIDGNIIRKITLKLVFNMPINKVRLAFWIEQGENIDFIYILENIARQPNEFSIKVVEYLIDDLLALNLKS